MKTENYLGLTLSVGFGLWWALFPNGVIRFYEWFHRRKMSTPKPLAIRTLASYGLPSVNRGTLQNLDDDS